MTTSDIMIEAIAREVTVTINIDEVEVTNGIEEAEVEAMIEKDTDVAEVTVEKRESITVARIAMKDRTKNLAVQRIDAVHRVIKVRRIGAVHHIKTDQTADQGAYRRENIREIVEMIETMHPNMIEIEPMTTRET